MKYYIDTEFLEGTQKEKFPISLFRKETKPTIDLISIGIISEDNREYYAVSKDFNLEEAWNRFDWKHGLGEEPEKVYWIRENVLKPIYNDMLYLFNPVKHNIFSRDLWEFNYSNFKYLLSLYGKTNKQIAEEVKDFCSYKGTKYGTYMMGNNGPLPIGTHDKDYSFDRKLIEQKRENLDKQYVKEREDGIHKMQVVIHEKIDNTNPEFYAYYADYDWVAFCWLFGKMMDLPKGFPMYCRDLKQMLDEKIQYYYDFNGDGRIYYGETKNDFIYADKIKEHPYYPKQENVHNALADACWNKKLHEFLNSI